MILHIFKTFLYVFTLLVCILFGKNVSAEVTIEKYNGVVDWDKASNYIEAKKIMEKAKQINKDKRRRKQLKDAGVPENEIKTIMQNEKKALEYGNINYIKNIKNNEEFVNNEDNEEDEESEIINKNDNEIEINYKKPIAKNDTLINDYDNISNNSVVQEEEKFIDLTIVPEVKKNNNNDVILATNNNYYDDFELSRMLQKASENVNDGQNFAIFAKEIYKIANKPLENKQIIVPELENYDYLDEDANMENSNKYANKTKKKKNFYLKNKTNSYNKNFGSMYAFSSNDSTNLNKNKQTKHSKSNRFDANTNVKEDKNENDEEELEILTTNTVTDKQIKAKTLNAQYPIKREEKNYNTQYQPQNIAQIAYDKNNKHLQPVVFESHLINQVFENLGSSNSIQLAKALINKVGYTDIVDDDGNTLLMHAVARRDQSLIAMLLSEGANPNYLNSEGFSPLHLAASNGDNTSIYSLLMGGGNSNLLDNNGNTSLMYCAKMCDSNSIKLMLALGGDPTIKSTTTNKTAIDFSYENTNTSITPLLVMNQSKIQGKRNPVNLVNKLNI